MMIAFVLFEYCQYLIFAYIMLLQGSCFMFCKWLKFVLAWYVSIVHVVRLNFYYNYGMSQEILPSDTSINVHL